MKYILTTENLSKNFGKIKAVNQLSLQIPRNSVFGILGPNGSGKTTTLGMVLGVVNASSGTYSWFGNRLNSGNDRKRIGAILESPTFYPYLSAIDNLKIVATIKQQAKGKFKEVLQMVGLYDRRNDLYKTYSLGMKQRLAIASVLLCDPEVLVLDEPTNGLDPQGIAEIRELIIKVAKKGKTVILASHILAEVQKVCTHFAVLRNGNLLFSGSVDSMRKENEEIEIATDSLNDLYAILESYPKAEKITKENNFYLVKLTKGTTILEFNTWLTEQKVIATHLLVREKSLEKQFLEILDETNH